MWEHSCYWPGFPLNISIALCKPGVCISGSCWNVKWEARSVTAVGRIYEVSCMYQGLSVNVSCWQRWWPPSLVWGSCQYWRYTPPEDCSSEAGPHHWERECAESLGTQAPSHQSLLSSWGDVKITVYDPVSLSLSLSLSPPSPLHSLHSLYSLCLFGFNELPQLWWQCYFFFLLFFHQ